MIDDYMLYKNLPSIDLHGYDRYGAVFFSKDFLNDNYKLKNKLVLIIHGKGKSILKEAVHNMLKHNKLVKAYRLDIYNNGITVVELK